MALKENKIQGLIKTDNFEDEDNKTYFLNIILFNLLKTENCHNILKKFYFCLNN